MATGTSGLDWWRDQNEKDKEQERNAKRRAQKAREQYPWNVRLLAFVVVGGMLWYYWHVEPMMRGTMIIGTPLTLWAGLKFMQSFLPKESRWSDDPHATSRRMLAQPNARRYLWVAAGIVAFLLLTTSSVYLEYDENEGNGIYEVTIYRGHDLAVGNLLMPPQKVSSYSSTPGKIFFLDLTSLFRPRELRMEFTRLPYRHEKLLSMRWPWSYRIQVPNGFEENPLRVFRLLPDGERWMALNVRKFDPYDSMFRLVVLLKRESEEEELLFVHFFFEPVYFGGPIDMIEYFQSAERQDPDRRRWNMFGHMQETFDQNDELFAAKAEMFMRKQTVRETEEIDKGETLIVRVLKQDLQTKTWSLYGESEHVVGPEGGIQNIYIPN